MKSQQREQVKRSKYAVTPQRISNGEQAVLALRVSSVGEKSLNGMGNENDKDLVKD